jgi:hypothetical protein
VGRAKWLALVAWLPVVAGAILATYGNTAWNQFGVVVWATGVVLQLGLLTLLLRRSRLRRLGGNRSGPTP